MWKDSRRTSFDEAKSGDLQVRFCRWQIAEPGFVIYRHKAGSLKPKLEEFIVHAENNVTAANTQFEFIRIVKPPHYIISKEECVLAGCLLRTISVRHIHRRSSRLLKKYRFNRNVFGSSGVSFTVLLRVPLAIANCRFTTASINSYKYLSNISALSEWPLCRDKLCHQRIPRRLRW